VAWSDGEDVPRVAVVDEAFVENFFEGTVPVGQEFRFNCSGPWVRVIGVVANTKTGTRLEVRPTVYVPYRQGGSQLRTLTVRTNGDYETRMSSARGVMKGLDPDVPVLDAMTPLEFRDLLIKRERFSAGLLIGFSLTGLLLSCLGLYSMLAYTVSQRSIRMALGARSRQILQMVIRESVAPVVVGLMIGLAGAFALTQWVDGISGYLKTTLFGVSIHDPLVALGAAFLFLFTGAIACAVPAVRACSVTPMRTLRHE
jgi:predicted lysophospholipase L1 biosynthesis ABC-type transport system permease subunit